MVNLQSVPNNDVIGVLDQKIQELAGWQTKVTNALVKHGGDIRIDPPTNNLVDNMFNIN